MIGKISGRVDYRGSDHVLLDVRGVGYIVHVSDRTMASLPPVGEAAALYTELLVREDLLQLFGFPTLYEKEWHRLLMTVQGVGAKAALSILGALGAEGTARAIALGDARAIQAAQGVGPKIAQRVVLELKSKAPAAIAMGGTMETAPELDSVVEVETPKTRPAPKGPSTAAPSTAALSADVLSALVNLGYGQSDAAEAVAVVSGENPGADTGTLIRLALKRLAPKV
jgi:Holliday junction DNA helicase RuvA